MPYASALSSSGFASAAGSLDPPAPPDPPASPLSSVTTSVAPPPTAMSNAVAPLCRGEGGPEWLS